MIPFKENPLNAIAKIVTQLLYLTDEHEVAIDIAAQMYETDIQFIHNMFSTVIYFPRFIINQG